MVDKKSGSLGCPDLAVVSPHNSDGADVLPLDHFSRSLERFNKSFEASARRWELIVYPSLFAFIVLACYGFFLIYSLTSDVARVAQNMEQLASNMNAVTESMLQVSENMTAVSSQMATINESLSTVNVAMTQVSERMQTMEPLLTQIAGINQNVATMTNAMQVMTASMEHMRRDVSVLNHSISRPIGFMSSLMPW